MQQDRENYRKCSSCGWIHYGISQEDAEQEIRDFNKMYATLSDSEKIQLYGGKAAKLDDYKSCANCAASYQEMTLLEPHDFKRIKGKTMQPILLA